MSAIEGADPTAPGGMSEKALIAELVDEHGWRPGHVKAMTWPEKIDLVCTLRQEFEDTSEVPDVDEYGDPVGEEDDDPMMMDGAGEAMQELAELLTHPTPEEVRAMGFPAEFSGEMEGGLFIGMPGTKDYIFDGHRGAGPSGAERWMACTASLGASRAFLETLTPNQQAEYAKGSGAARQGTTAHSVAEVQAHVLLGQITPEEAETTLLELSVMPEDGGEAYDEEMERYVAEYVDFVQQYVDEGREVLIEQRVEACIPLLTVTDGEEDTYTIAGALDLGVMPTEDEPVLVVGDLKYGEGIDVDPDSNPQVRIYALGLLALIVERFNGLPDWLTDVEYVIVQPRLGGIKAWTESVDDLLDWQDNVLSKALTLALAGVKGGAAFTPGEVQCHWCPARGGCPALIEDRMEKAADLFDVVTEGEFSGDGFPETGELTNERLASLYTQITGLTKLAAEMKEELQRRLFRGSAVPGYHLVNYSPPRRWKEDAADELKYGSILSAEQLAQLEVTKLVTPTAAEKMLGDEYEKIEALIEKPDKRPVVAPEGDRRSVWEGKAPEDMFDVEE